MSQPFYVMTIPGLETLAFSEIRARDSTAEQIKFARGIALFRTDKSAGELLKLRTVEDVFFLLVHIKTLGPGRDALRVLHSATLKADITAGLTWWRHVHKGRQARTWRVVSQMSGRSDFRRIDAGQAVSDALRKVMPRGMRLVDDHADLEIWLWISGGLVLIGVRLSDATMRHREYKREHLPASLRPTVAAAMSWLARPTAQDVVLDPMCGAGTILIERALLAPYQRLLGGDIRDEAIAVAERNAWAAHIEVEWRVWDARSLPLGDASVTRLLTNLPFGKQIAAGENLRDLYGALLREFGRVLTPAGLMVTLTSEDQLWNTLLHDQGWRVVKKMVPVILGQPASIFVAEHK
ncbi:MAG: RNA methyltransferase [Ktedonobacteraceae bacterium]|nr:RNA methyltransferase [Ktedonobacteraceae bacterium]